MCGTVQVYNSRQAGTITFSKNDKSVIAVIRTITVNNIPKNNSAVSLGTMVVILVIDKVLDKPTNH